MLFFCSASTHKHCVCVCDIVVALVSLCRLKKAHIVPHFALYVTKRKPFHSGRLQRKLFLFCRRFDLTNKTKSVSLRPGKKHAAANMWPDCNLERLSQESSSPGFSHRSISFHYFWETRCESSLRCCSAPWWRHSTFQPLEFFFPILCLVYLHL